MMKTSAMVLASGALALCCSACSTICFVPAEKMAVQTVTGDTNVETIGHVHVNSWGMYLFCWPVITGDFNNRGSFVWFSDTVTPDNAARSATHQALNNGGDAVLDLKTDYDSSWDGGSYLWVFWLRETSACGNVVKYRPGARKSMLPPDSPVSLQ